MVSRAGVHRRLDEADLHPDRSVVQRIRTTRQGRNISSIDIQESHERSKPSSLSDFTLLISRIGRMVAVVECVYQNINNATKSFPPQHGSQTTWMDW